MKPKITFLFIPILFLSIVSQNKLTAQAKIYGTNLFGGKDGAGTIFSMDVDGSNFETTYNFKHLNVESPLGKLLKADNGKFYGISTQGGNNNRGTLYELEPETKEIIVLHDFDSRPTQIILASDGKIYGICYSSNGPLFSFDIQTNTYAEEYVFNEGFAIPWQIVEGSPGIIYGTVNVVPDAGYAGAGGIFAFNTITKTSELKLKFRELGVANPNGQAILASNNKIYASTHGVYYNATSPNNRTSKIYEYNITTNTAKIIAEITNPVRKFYDVAELAPGFLYGVKRGDSGYDEVFKIDISTYEMTTIGNVGPVGTFIEKLLLASDGNIYGLSKGGGANNFGSIYAISTDDVVTTVFDFENSKYPFSGLTEIDSGELIGFVNSLDTGMEILFTYNLAKKNVKKISGINTPEVRYPVALTQIDDKLYGLSYDGGENNLGNIFYYHPATDKLQVEYHFSSDSGSEPYGAPVHKNGFIYGTTTRGGDNNQGTLFKYQLSTGTYTKLHDFTISEGTNFGSIMFASNGLIYGFTSVINSSENEIIFSYDLATDTFAVLHEFQEGEASVSLGYFVEYQGKLYASSLEGGSVASGTSKGTLFSYDINSSTYKTEVDLNTIIGAEQPEGSLLLGSNNKFYGLTHRGGDFDKGTIFEYIPATSQFKVLHSFSGIDGEFPQESTLIEVGSGMLFGQTNVGGVNDLGIVFSYDFLSNEFTKLKDMDEASGSNPLGQLVLFEANSLANTKSTKTPFKFKVYPNPSNDILHIENSENVHIKNLQLLDILGKIVYTNEHDFTEINMKSFRNGIYLLNIETELGKKTFKILKN